jgi:hypothetical protein
MASERGEIRFNLGGKERMLRPTWKAISELEDQFGTTLLGIAERLQDRKFTAKDIVTTIWCGLRGAGETLTIEEVGELVVNDGLFNVMEPLAKFIAEACTGGRKIDPKS